MAYTQCHPNCIHYYDIMILNDFLNPLKSLLIQQQQLTVFLQ